jgi:hypothetical protein
MWLQASYHGYMRAALRLRRALRSRGTLEVPDDATALGYQAAADEPRAVDLNAAALRAIAKPDGGRLNPWVFKEVAKLHGATPDEVRVALFVR